MTTRSDVKSIHATLSTTTEDVVKLSQRWDMIEIENKDTTNGMYARLDGTAAVAAAANTEYIGPNSSKIFQYGIVRGGSVNGSTADATAPHYISVIGNGNAYGVIGLPRA